MEEYKYQISDAKNGLIYLARGDEPAEVVRGFKEVKELLEGLKEDNYKANDNAEDPLDDNTQTCPKCNGGMWDNRVNKKNPKAPDFKCKDTNCDGVIWPDRTEPFNKRKGKKK